MQKRLMGVAVGLGVFVASVTLAGAAGNPPNVVCHSGDILEGTYHNVAVAKGNFCLVLGATVTGDVQANNALQIGIDNSSIGGNVQANNVTGNGWVCGSTIGGNVDVGNNAANSAASPGTWFIGDASWCIPQFDPQPGNYVAGNLQFHNNATGGVISNTDVEANLDCHSNTPSPTGSNNAVDGSAKGQCAALAGGADDSASPPDSD
jgi:hypothetical protein